MGVRRFDDFQQRLGVTRHVLSDRLRKLTEGGVLDKVAYQERPLRHEYRLTAMGKELYPVIVHLAQWGDKHLAGEHGAPSPATTANAANPWKRNCNAAIAATW